MAHNERIPKLYTSVLYLIGFILFLEWLYPASAIGDTDSLHIFILYTLFCMLLTALSIKWWGSFLLKGMGLLIAIQELFIPEPFLSKSWFVYFSQDIWVNIQLLFAQNWYELTPLFRTFLLLIVIWLMSYLIHYWFVVTRRFLLFIVLTFVFLAILDTFTPYNANAAMVRTFFISFLALGLANLSKVVNRESIAFNWRKRSFSWILPLVFLVLFSSVIGYGLPKYQPKWPDPVPFVQNMSDHIGFTESESLIQKSGYTSEDEELGGSFVQDDSPVFEVITTEEQYWRVNTKDIYTGKGWEDSSAQLKKPARNGNVRLNLYDSDLDTEEKKVFVEFEEDAHVDGLVYPYGVSRIHPMENDVEIEYEEFGGIFSTQDGKSYDLDEYGITYDKPKLITQKLENTEEVATDLVGLQYTAVPATVPDRVVELAEEVTESYDTNFDKARAIESYFGENGFQYETEDIPYPEEDEDYVDQFLFESKQGYCDNYSTSMVVMLRTLDIPARWAKGFTSGELVDEEVDPEEEDLDLLDRDGDYQKYEVQNLNAHSWVEVYFSNIGWVPFEPTQGFSNLTDFDSEEEESAEEEEENEADNELNNEEKTPDILEEDAEDTKAAEKDEEKTSPFMWLLLLIPIVAGLIIYRYRIEIQTWMIRTRMKHRHDVNTYQKAYLHLLKLLNIRGIIRRPEQTLRDYAKRVDYRYRTTDMSQLTYLYEKVLYNDQDDVSADEIRQLWESLVKQLTT